MLLAPSSPSTPPQRREERGQSQEAVADGRGNADGVRVGVGEERSGVPFGFVPQTPEVALSGGGERDVSPFSPPRVSDGFDTELTYAGAARTMHGGDHSVLPAWSPVDDSHSDSVFPCAVVEQFSSYWDAVAVREGESELLYYGTDLPIALFSPAALQWDLSCCVLEIYFSVHLCDSFRHAFARKSFTYHLRGQGGICPTAVELHDAIKRVRADRLFMVKALVKCLFFVFTWRELADIAPSIDSFCQIRGCLDAKSILSFFASGAVVLNPLQRFVVDCVLESSSSTLPFTDEFPLPIVTFSGVVAISERIIEELRKATWAENVSLSIHQCGACVENDCALFGVVPVVDLILGCSSSAFSNELVEKVVDTLASASILYPSPFRGRYRIIGRSCAPEVAYDGVFVDLKIVPLERVPLCLFLYKGPGFLREVENQLDFLRTLNDQGEKESGKIGEKEIALSIPPVRDIVSLRPIGSRWESSSEAELFDILHVSPIPETRWDAFLPPVYDP